MDTPGKEGTTFKITLTPEMFEKPTVIDDTILKVLSEPIRHRHQWYWRVLYYLTFKNYFGIQIQYQLEILNKPYLNNE